LPTASKPSGYFFAFSGCHEGSPMQLFECQGCLSALHFENTQCLTCGRAVGYLQDKFEMTALEDDCGRRLALGDERRPYRYCDNAAHGACNWLVAEGSPQRLCEACRPNRTIPDLSIPENVTRWAKIEMAKRYVFRALLRLRLPHPSKLDDPERGLAFDILGDVEAGGGPATQVMTGHDNGLITLNLAEGDDAEREKRRTSLAEPYRTLVGHFRHEIDHYYWDRLVRDGGRLDAFRAVFGDERENYAQALQRYYSAGAPAEAGLRFISAYASAHPFEDFAETFAHYLHIVDALETARSYGIDVRAHFMPDASGARIDFNPYAAPSAERLVEAWTPLTVALNGVNRSMGLQDLYPFVLNAAVMDKLEFVHELIRDADDSRSAPAAQAA
jgi:hypothetical protein